MSRHNNTSHELNLTLLQFVANRLRDRDTTVLKSMGFGPAEIEALGELKLNEFAALGRRMPDHLMRVELDRKAFHLMLEQTQRDTRQQIEITLQLLRCDASHEMMRRLFGIGSRDFAQLRNTLELPPIVGRPSHPTEEEARNIWDIWSGLGLQHPSIASPEQWLQVVQQCGLSAGLVWRLIWKWYEEDDDADDEHLVAGAES